VGISQNYLLQTRCCKQTIEIFLGYWIISFDPLKYTKNKQSVRNHGGATHVFFLVRSISCLARFHLSLCRTAVLEYRVRKLRRRVKRTGRKLTTLARQREEKDGASRSTSSRCRLKPGMHRRGRLLTEGSNRDPVSFRSWLNSTPPRRTRPPNAPPPRVRDGSRPRAPIPTPLAVNY
jgi:hypothetical protein